MVSLEELSRLSKSVNIKREDCNIIASNENKAFWGCRTAIAEKDGHYYMFEENCRFKPELEELACLYEKNARINTSAVREIFLDKKSSIKSSMDFYYTPDDVHRYYISANPETGICGVPDPHDLTLDQIKEGMSCTYKGITMTYNDENSIAIERQGMCRIIPVEKDNEFTYRFLKTKIKAINGAKGLFQHFENAAEEEKFEYSNFSSCFRVAAKMLCDEKRPPFSLENPQIRYALPEDKYQAIVYRDNGDVICGNYNSIERAQEDGKKCLEKGFAGFIVCDYDTGRLRIKEGDTSKETIYQVITDAGFDGGIDDKLEYIRPSGAFQAAEQYLKEGYEGYAIYEKNSKIIKTIKGDFRVEKAFNEEILKINGLYSGPDKDLSHAMPKER